MLYLFARQSVGQPVKTFIETITSGGTSGLNVPFPVGDRVKTKLVGNFADTHGIRKILLVGEHKEDSFTKFIFTQHFLQLLIRFRYTLTIVAVNDENQTLSILEVMAQKRTNLKKKGEKKRKNQKMFNKKGEKKYFKNTLSCPPTSHTVKLIFLYSTVSTLKPMVGMVVTISPSLSL